MSCEENVAQVAQTRDFYGKLLWKKSHALNVPQDSTK